MPDSLSEPVAMLTVARKAFRKSHLGHGFLISVVAIVLSVLALFLWPRSSQASLVLRISNQTRMFQGPVVEGMTVFDALQASAKAGKFPLKYTEDQKFRLMQLANYSSGLDRADIYLNGEYIPLDKINSTPIHSGDSITVQLP